MSYLLNQKVKNFVLFLIPNNPPQRRLFYFQFGPLVFLSTRHSLESSRKRELELEKSSIRLIGQEAQLSIIFLTNDWHVRGQPSLGLLESDPATRCQTPASFHDPFCLGATTAAEPLPLHGAKPHLLPIAPCLHCSQPYIFYVLSIQFVKLWILNGVSSS